MNYRHAYHAGNHGDVLKHIVLAKIIEALKKKERGFLVLDAHAGTGLYALDGVEAEKTREWEQGIGRMRGVSAAAALNALVAGLNPGGGLRLYPGSPEIARRLLRPQDRMIFNELHPQDHATLAARYAGDARIAVTALDAGAAVKAHLPPPERRGLILIDPAYEEKDEEARVEKMLKESHRRFATGCFMVWYPVVEEGLGTRLAAEAANLAPGKTLRAELRLRPVQPQGGLVGSGLIILNPPWGLEEELRKLLPELLQALEGAAGTCTIATT